MARPDIHYVIPMDDDEDSPAIDLTIDAASDLEINQGGIRIVPTLVQAYALHQALGQLLVRHKRSWGTKPPVLRSV